jgi:hypothetical protein
MVFKAERLEFSKPVKMQMFRRAGGPEKVLCEGCGLRLKKGDWDYDHTVAEWILDQIAHDLREPLTAEDGKLLGKSCCHKPKTSKENKARSHGKRIQFKAAKADRPKGPPILGSKRSGWKKPMRGDAVRRSDE